MSEAKQLYLDDLHVGERFTSESYLLEAARIQEFAAEFDPQPFHLDQVAAEASDLEGLAASGWHTAAVAMRLLAAGGLPFANGIIGLGGEIAWPRGLGPADFSAEADNAISEWQAAVNQEPHGNGGGMPAAGRQSFKNARPCRRFVAMERLGVELSGELFNTRRFHQIAS